ncbi:MAG TPA: Gfo/Idh/MocA family oxidoreductase [Terriglobales bacterium]|nr:Gfo/Idh/MocA family oxidoreductase [Terriglobales bacterium]
MKTSKTRIGIVGIGFGERILAPAFALNSSCEVSAVCATTQDHALSAARRLGVAKAYHDWRSLVNDSQIDALAIATPPTVQPDIAIPALQCGKAVFCEKPVSTSTEAASALVAAANKAGVANMVDFEFPEIPLWSTARDIVNRGGVGTIRHVIVNWQVETYAIRKRLSSWKTDPSQGGGTLFSFVSHVFYYLEWLLGPIRDLSCTLFPLRCEQDAPEFRDAFVTLVLRLATGTPVSVSVSTGAFLGSGHSLEIYGDSGTLSLRNETSDYISGFRLFHGTRDSNRLQEIAAAGETLGPGRDGRIDAVGKLVNRFVDWIQTGNASHPTLKDGLRVQTLLECALKSHSTGRFVSCEG